MSESRRRFMWNVQLVKNETYSLTHRRTIWEPWIFIVSSRLALTASIRKQKGSKYTRPQTNQKKKKKKPKYTKRNEQVSEGSSREDANSFWWGYLPTQVEFPFREGEPSGQLQRCSAERLTKLNLKTTCNRMIRNSSIISTGLNSQ